MPHKSRANDIRRTLYELLEQGPIGERRTRLVSRLIILLIVLNLVTAALETVPALDAQYARVFAAIEWISLVVFSAEYLARLWCAAEHAPSRHLSAARARLKFVLSPAGLVDLLAVLPFWIGIFLELDLRFLLVFRIVRFLKLARYSPAMRSLIEALYAERRALFGCVVILIGTTLVTASLMHLAERHVQPEKLGTIPDAMWWAIVTLGTIGYGDVVPMTPLGKLIAAVTIFLGLVMVALPVGIIATAFSEQIHRRDFVVTWGMVAKVPLFSELEAGDIADIMQLLRAQTVEPGATVVRRGDPAHSMYFIAAGEVEIELKDQTVRLGVGHFFGEIAVLRRARRSASVTALTRANLLVLDGHDLHALMEREPRVAARMREMIRAKLGREVVGARGDIVTEEIDEGELEREAGR
jgi:voltage-gated potassium channel